MKLALLHGAVKNAGDFLIKDRTKNLIKQYYPKYEIIEFCRNEELSERWHEIESCDGIVFAGGPGYTQSFSSKKVSVLKNVLGCNKPVFILGMGSYIADDNPLLLYNVTISDEFTQILRRSGEQTGMLGGRDWYSVIILRNAGLEQARLTGCPAWYNLDKIHQTEYSGADITKVKTICISDAQKECSINAFIKIMLWTRRFFGPNVKINLVSHRGEMDPEFVKLAESLNIEIKNIHGSAEGFSIYNECDLHIGFRVHAHIYCMSERILSVLIEEDVRGCGQNETLGLARIKSYALEQTGEFCNFVDNQVLELQVEDYLLNLHYSNYERINRAYRTMEQTYLEMEKQILGIGKVLEG